MNRSRTAQAMDKVGGRFRLCVLLQKRVIELSHGAPQLVEFDSRNYIDVAIEEILANKISLVTEEVVPEPLEELEALEAETDASDAAEPSSVSI